MKVPPVALVIGGAKRVGRAIVEELRGRGFRVLFTYRTHRASDAWLNDPDAIQADLMEPDVASRLQKSLIEKSDRLDVLVNCASLYAADPTDGTAMFRTNYEAPVEIARAFAEQLSQSRGCVINMLDILAERPMPGYSTYCASKAALWNATLSLARELAPDVRVNGIAPGVVDWPADLPQAARDAYLKRVPLACAGTPQDVAKLVHFLAVDGTYITGQVIRLDGGRSIV